MSSKKRSGKAVWIVASAVILTMLLLLTLFITQTAPDRQESIVLPPASGANGGNQEQTEISDSQSEHFVAVSNENVAAVLRTLNRPAAYYQSYKVTVGGSSKQHTKNVNLWINGNLFHAEVTEDGQKQNLITDGVTVHLWYDDGKQPISLELPQGVTPEDLLGLPDLNAYLKISQDTVTESDYRVLEEEQVQCIYVCTQDADSIVSQYWVNLENGLLYQADTKDSDKSVYTVVQTAFDQLSVEDEDFSGRFVLPDGSAPFTAETEALQP